jgi:hypothetical protein
VSEHSRNYISNLFLFSSKLLIIDITVLHVNAYCRYLPKVFDRFAGAEGFLFLQDHMVLNYWNLLNSDKTKLWITNQVHIHVIISIT